MKGRSKMIPTADVKSYQNIQMSRRDVLLHKAEKNGWQREWFDKIPTKVLTSFVGKKYIKIHKANTRIIDGKKVESGGTYLANWLKKISTVFNKERK